MNRLALILITWSLLLAGQPLRSQIREFSLKEAQEYAVNHNYQARNAVIDIAIAERKVRETLASALPQLDASISYNNFINLATQLIPAEFFGGEPGTYMEVQFGTKHNASVQAQLKQLLFNGAWFVGLKVAREARELTQIQLEQAQQEVRQAVANAYYLVLVAQDNLRLMTETIKTMEGLLQETDALFKQGFLEETDVDKLRLLLSELQTNRLMAENQIRSAEYLLKFNLGLSVTDEISLTDNLQMLLMAADPQSFLSEDFDPRNHVTFRMLDVQENIAGLQVKMARTAFMPTAAAFLSQTENAQRNQFNFLDFNQKWFPTTLLGVQISIPILSSGQRIQNTRRASLELEKVINTKRQVTESLKMGVLTSKNNFDVAAVTYRNKKENYELACRIYDKDQIRYKAGIASGTDLKQSYNTLLEAQGAYLGAALEMLNKEIELRKALSKL